MPQASPGRALSVSSTSSDSSQLTRDACTIQPSPPCLLLHEAWKKMHHLRSISSEPLVCACAGVPQTILAGSASAPSLNRSVWTLADGVANTILLFLLLRPASTAVAPDPTFADVPPAWLGVPTPCSCSTEYPIPPAPVPEPTKAVPEPDVAVVSALLRPRLRTRALSRMMAIYRAKPPAEDDADVVD